MSTHMENALPCAAAHAASHNHTFRSHAARFMHPTHPTHTASPTAPLRHLVPPVSSIQGSSAGTWSGRLASNSPGPSRTPSPSPASTPRQRPVLHNILPELSTLEHPPIALRRVSSDSDICVPEHPLLDALTSHHAAVLVSPDRDSDDERSPQWAPDTPTRSSASLWHRQRRSSGASGPGALPDPDALDAPFWASTADDAPRKAAEVRGSLAVPLSCQPCTTSGNALRALSRLIPPPPIEDPAPLEVTGPLGMKLWLRRGTAEAPGLDQLTPASESSCSSLSECASSHGISKTQRIQALVARELARKQQQPAPPSPRTPPFPPHGAANCALLWLEQQPCLSHDAESPYGDGDDASPQLSALYETVNRRAHKTMREHVEALNASALVAPFASLRLSSGAVNGCSPTAHTHASNAGSAVQRLFAVDPAAASTVSTVNAIAFDPLCDADILPELAEAAALPPDDVIPSEQQESASPVTGLCAMRRLQSNNTDTGTQRLVLHQRPPHTDSPESLAYSSGACGSLQFVLQQPRMASSRLDDLKDVAATPTAVGDALSHDPTTACTIDPLLCASPDVSRSERDAARVPPIDSVNQDATSQPPAPWRVSAHGNRVPLRSPRSAAHSLNYNALREFNTMGSNALPSVEENGFSNISGMLSQLYDSEGAHDDAEFYDPRCRGADGTATWLSSTCASRSSARSNAAAAAAPALLLYQREMERVMQAVVCSVRETHAPVRPRLGLRFQRAR